MDTSKPDLSGRELLEALTSGALLTTPEGGVLYANPTFCRLAHLPENQVVVDSRLDTIFSLPPRTDCALCLGATQTAGQWATAHGAFLRILLNDKQEDLRVKIKHSTLPDGSVLTIVDPFSEDATLTQAHSDFVSTVSHEFRTPLTSIKGFADTLLNYGTQLPDEEKRRFVNIIKDQADRLIRLVENLLTVSKLGAGKVDLSYRPVALERLIEKTVHSVQIKAKTKTPTANHRFDVAVQPKSLEVWADADRLEQILINLVDNAMKYSPGDSTVHIRAELLPGDDNQVRISVRDEGVGIPAELLPKIFTKFYRVESPLRQEVEGTGLGLYITRSLATAMGGKILAESPPGQGSTFTLLFPAATPERQAMHRRRLAAEEP